MSQANFDLIAKPYRWLEYLTFGSALQKTRLHYLSELSHCRNALLLGDGDGRFTAALLMSNPNIHVLAVDSSAAMLQLLRQRCESTIPDSTHRLHIEQTDAVTLSLADNYDLIVTHFFLDCLTQPELNSLVPRIAKHMQPGALWLLSDFRIPANPAKFPTRILVRSLYLAFRILTNLRTTHLPDHATALQQSGLTRVSQHNRLAEILTTELWRRSLLPLEVSS
jgi:ubiquinone/menaquinone biosynthesis C-methylase UbiE